MFDGAAATTGAGGAGATGRTGSGIVRPISRSLMRRFGSGFVSIGSSSSVASDPRWPGPVTFERRTGSPRFNGESTMRRPPSSRSSLVAKAPSGSVFVDHGISVTFSAVTAAPYARDSAATTIWPSGGRAADALIWVLTQPRARYAAHAPIKIAATKLITLPFRIVSSLSTLTDGSGSTMNSLLPRTTDLVVPQNGTADAPLLRRAGATLSHHWRAGVKILACHRCLCTRYLHIAEAQ